MSVDLAKLRPLTYSRLKKLLRRRNRGAQEKMTLQQLADQLYELAARNK